MLDAIAKMAARPVAEVRRANMLAGDVGRVVRILRSQEQHALGNSVDEVPAPSPDTSDENAGVERSASVPRSPTVASGSGDHSSTPMRPLKADAGATRDPTSLSVPDAWGSNRTRTQDRWRARADSLQRRWRADLFACAQRKLRRACPRSSRLPNPCARATRSSTVEVIAIDRRRTAAGISGSDAPVRGGRGISSGSAWSSRLQLFVFDLIGLDGNLLIDVPYEERYAALSDRRHLGCSRESRANRAIDRCRGQSVLRARDRGRLRGYRREGARQYLHAGSTRSRWIKIKAARTLDLVIVAADWGYGRRPRLALELSSGRA